MDNNKMMNRMDRLEASVKSHGSRLHKIEVQMSIIMSLAQVHLKEQNDIFYRRLVDEWRHPNPE